MFQSQKVELQKETDLLQDAVEKLQCELVELMSKHEEDIRQKDSERENLTSLRDELQVGVNDFCWIIFIA